MKKIEEQVGKEKLLMDLEQEFVEEFVSLRKGMKLTQQEMADASSVIRETIARIENCITSPQVRTLIKILEPFGYTIKISKIKKK